MICPVCGEETSVINSRDYDGGCAVKRRRKCIACDYRFTTIELDSDMLDTKAYKPSEDRKHTEAVYKIVKDIPNLTNRNISDFNEWRKKE